MVLLTAAPGQCQKNLRTAFNGWKFFYNRGTGWMLRNWNQQYHDSARWIYGCMLLQPEIHLDYLCTGRDAAELE